MKMVPLIVCGFLSLLFLSPPVHAEEPSDVVKKLQGALLLVMKDADQLGYQGRYDTLEPVILASHDIPLMVKVAVSKKYWKTFDEEQRKNLVSTSRHLSIATYAGRFDGYSGEQFTVVSEKELPRGKMLVETKFTKSDGEELQFNYILRQVDGHWRIINVTVDGVSDLATKRAEYKTLVKNDGYAALITKMEDQIKRYANGE